MCFSATASFTSGIALVGLGAAAVPFVHRRRELLFATLPLAVPYVVVTCGALLLSSQRFVVAFGVAMTAAMAATALMEGIAFSSVWCFFAALLSGAIVVHHVLATRPTRGLRPAAGAP